MSKKGKVARLVEEIPGLLWGVYWGKELLTGGTNPKRLQEVVDLINVGRAA